MAGMVSKDVIDQIRNALDISDVIGSYIQIKRAGHVAKALCPFHKEKTPSFHINPARQAFHCFGCGAGGDVFKFVMMYENVDFPTALRMLASRAGVAVQFDPAVETDRNGVQTQRIAREGEAVVRKVGVDHGDKLRLGVAQQRNAARHETHGGGRQPQVEVGAVGRHVAPETQREGRGREPHVRRIVLVADRRVGNAEVADRKPERRRPGRAAAPTAPRPAWVRGRPRTRCAPGGPAIR